MTNATHFAPDLLMAFILMLTIFGMFNKSERPGSTKILALCAVASMLACISDALTSVRFAPEIPVILHFLVVYVYWISGDLLIILFIWYCYAYVMQRDHMDYRINLIPITLLLGCVAALIIMGIQGKLFDIQDGVVIFFAHKHWPITLINAGAIVYLVGLAINKRKAVGNKAALLIAIFGLSPFSTRLYAMLTGCHDYTYLGTGIAMLVAYLFVDNQITEEREREQRIKVERAMEEVVAANAAKTSFLFNMSHDIRTPMNAITGFTSLLRKHQDNPERRNDYLNKIENSSEILLSIINHVLEMARIEKGTSSVELAEVSLRENVQTLCTTMQEVMAGKNITLTWSVEVDHNHIMGDQTKIVEIFNNILSNAFKYTNPGGRVELKIDELPSDLPGQTLIRTTVTDTGIGMSEDFLPHIFDEFARESTTTVNKIEGTGLGMPIVKRLVQLLHGTIEVQSKKGVGSTFTVVLPHQIVEHPTEEVVRPVSDATSSDFTNKRILLAEDNDLNAEIAMEILQEKGFLVDRASDGTICVDMLYQAPAHYYDIILMDIQMPHMDGYEATRHIRALADTAKANIPILALSANAFEEDRKLSLSVGMNGHLAKPINVPDLIRTLSEIL